MKKRQKMSKKASKRVFRKGASKTHMKNLALRPMRGGYRA